jgi:hypothetical protein
MERFAPTGIYQPRKGSPITLYDSIANELAQRVPWRSFYED